MTDGWCPDCGLATNDPQHYGFHKIALWNRRVFADGAAAREAEFDDKLADHDRRHGRLPQDPQTGMDMSGAVRTGHRYEG